MHMIHNELYVKTLTLEGNCAGVEKQKQPPKTPPKTNKTKKTKPQGAC